MAAKNYEPSDKYLHFDMDPYGCVVDLDNLSELTHEPTISKREAVSSFLFKDNLTVSYPKDQDVNTKQGQQERDLISCTYEIAFEEDGEEADLKDAFTSCPKQKHHKDFRAVDDFEIHHLPEQFQDIDVVKMIQAIADITVKLNIRFVSKKRPKYWPQNDEQRLKGERPKLFPQYDKRGRKIGRQGTGRICRVEKCREESPQKTCMCTKCRVSDTPSSVWWTVGLYTAQHVVFDKNEAEETKCTLFNDNSENKEVTLNGWKIERTDGQYDMCVMVTTSCDEMLMTKLEKMLQVWRAQWEKLLKKYNGTPLANKLIVIVSHPHGLPKHISFGYLKNKHVKIQFMDTVTITTYTYSTATCPGSSGAHVHLIGSYDDSAFVDHVHNGFDDETGYNYCSPGVEYSFVDSA